MPGFVLYEGPSRLDGSPIVVIMTQNSSNRKTGDMAQTWILRADVEPNLAVKEGSDTAVCGSCPLRWSAGGEFKCYVVPGQAPLSVWRAWKRGIYPKFDKATQFVDGGLRLGSYGDPVAVPLDVWPSAKFTTGYTHQWSDPVAEVYKGTLMASVNSTSEMEDADRMGWRCFATWNGIEDETFLGLVVRCPSDKASGESIRTCDACRLCDGRRAHVWIKPH